MSHRTNLVITDRIYSYLRDASDKEDRPMSDIIMESVRLRERIKAGEFYILQDGEYVKVVML